MTVYYLSSHPFGTTLTLDDFLDEYLYLTDWQDKYAYLIDLGKQVPQIHPEYQISNYLIEGCQSQVWMIHSIDEDNHLYFYIYSDALIVRGLIAFILIAFNGKKVNEILTIDIEALLKTTELIDHLSPIRGNGFKSILHRIKTISEIELAK